MSAWDARIEVLEGGRTRRAWLLSGREPVPYADVLALWREDEPFRAFFDELLRDAPYEAYLWEVPPVRRVTDHRPFEFVQVDCPPLARASADAAAFAPRFADAEDGIATFPNLGGDALLLAPAPDEHGRGPAHLAAFLRDAPPARRHALWARIGAAVADRIGDEPLWLSTSGLGIAWLHVRLDSSPKYYSFGPYRDAR